LRIADREHFRVVYTLDNWDTTMSVDARSVGYPGSFVDISTAENYTGNIIFTLAWSEGGGQERWLGRNIDVSVISPPEAAR